MATEAQADGTVIADTANRILSDLNSLVASNDIVDVSRILILLSNLQKTSNPIYDSVIIHENSKLLAAAKELIENWRDEKLIVGAYLDCFSPNEGKWFAAKILERHDRNIKVHYLGWSHKYDQVINLDERDDIFPHTTRVKAMKKTEKKTEKKTSVYVPPSEIQQNVKTGAPEVPNTVTGSVSLEEPSSTPDSQLLLELGCEIKTTRSGRLVKTVAGSSTSSSHNKRKKGDSAEATEDNDDGSKRRKSDVSIAADGREYGSADKNDWFCKVCGLLEAKDGTELVLCDGPCLSSFHQGCLKQADKKAINESEKWLCKDCRTYSHACFICGKKGRDFVEVARCSGGNCGKFYHKSCLLSPSDAFFVIPEVRDSKKTVLLPPEHLLRQQSTAAQPMKPLSAKKKSRGRNSKQDDPDAVDCDDASIAAGDGSTTLALTPMKSGAGAAGGKPDGAINTHTPQSAASKEKDSVLVKAQVDTFVFKCPYHKCHTCDGVASSVSMYTHRASRFPRECQSS
jgi:hypothetical protein